MKEVQDLFYKIQDIKKKQRDIRVMVGDALKQSKAYQDVRQELNKVRDQKKEIERNVKSEYEKELSKLDDLKIDLESELEEFSDAALDQIMKGKVVKVRDSKNISYDVFVTAHFKKSDEQDA